jgi:hypothetical protein
LAFESAPFASIAFTATASPRSTALIKSTLRRGVDCGGARGGGTEEETGAFVVDVEGWALDSSTPNSLFQKLVSIVAFPETLFGLPHESQITWNS